MWLTRTAEGFRGWFSGEANGEPRPGFVATDVTINIGNPTDTAITTVGFTESSQIPGIYFFDLPSSFLVTHGTGGYPIQIVVDTTAGSGIPVVIDVFFKILKVDQNDVDTIRQAISPLYGNL